MERINAAMGLLDSFHIEGELVVKATREAYAALVSIQFEITVETRGDSQVLFTLDLESAGFGTITFEEREVQGVSYTQDPFSGEWEIGDADDPEDGSIEEVIPEGMVATGANTDVLDGLRVYRVTGTVPDDPEAELVMLWVGTDDLLVRQVLVQGRVPATDYEGLVPQQSGDFFQSSLSLLSRFNEPVLVTAHLVKATAELVPTSTATLTPRPTPTREPTPTPTPTPSPTPTLAPNSIEDYSMAKAVSGGVPILRTDTFLTWEPDAYSWVRFANLSPGEHRAKWEWYEPSGKPYLESEDLVLEGNGYPTYTVWGSIEIGNWSGTDYSRVAEPTRNQPEDRTGDWRVMVYFDGAVVLTEGFKIIKVPWGRQHYLETWPMASTKSQWTP